MIRRRTVRARRRAARPRNGAPSRSPCASRRSGRRVHRHRLPGGEQQEGRPDRRRDPRERVARRDPGARLPAERHGARPWSAARSRFIGLVADAIATTPFAGQIIHGAQDEAWKHGYALLIANTEGNRELEDDAIAMMLEYKVRGILYSTWFHRADRDPAGAPRGRLRPRQLLLREPARRRAVVPDEVQGGRTATEILLVAPATAASRSSTPPPPRPRTDGPPRRATARHSRRRASRSTSRSCSGSLPGPGGRLRRRRGDSSTAASRRCTATTTGWPWASTTACASMGCPSPTDVAVVGFDNQEVIAAHLRPPLSTVSLPHYELGAAGVRMLLGLEAAPEGGRLEVACPPVVRSSI